MKRTPSEAAELLRSFCEPYPRYSLKKRKKKKKCQNLWETQRHRDIEIQRDTENTETKRHREIQAQTAKETTRVHWDKERATKLTFYRIDHSALVCCQFREVLEDLVDLNDFALEVAHLIVALDDNTLKRNRERPVSFLLLLALLLLLLTLLFCWFSPSLLLLYCNHVRFQYIAADRAAAVAVAVVPKQNQSDPQAIMHSDVLLHHAGVSLGRLVAYWRRSVALGLEVEKPKERRDFYVSVLLLSVSVVVSFTLNLCVSLSLSLLLVLSVSLCLNHTSVYLLFLPSLSRLRLERPHAASRATCQSPYRASQPALSLTKQK